MTDLSYDFPLYSPRSRHVVDFLEAGEMQLLVAEGERTAKAFAAAAAAMVDKGTLTPMEARRTEDVLRAVATDLSAERAWIDAIAAGDDRPNLGAELERLAASSGVRWLDKVKVLRAELEERRRTYPADVDKGRLAPADARVQLERLEAVHAYYFATGFAWDSPTGAEPKSATWLGELRAHVNALADAQERKEAA